MRCTSRPGPVRRGAPVDVVLIERAVLQSWIEALAAHGLVAGYAAADAAMLPSVHGEATLLFDGDRVLVRSVDQVAAIEADALKLVLESLAAKAEAPGIRFVAVNGRVPELMRAEVAQATEHPRRVDRHRERRHRACASGRRVSRQAASDQSAARRAGAAEAGAAARGCVGAPLRRWSGVWIVVLVASEAVRGVWASHRAAALTEQIETRYKTLLSATIGAFPVRMRTHR